MLFQLQTIPSETVEQIASRSDSAKVVIKQFAESLATDPQGTISTFAADAVRFGIKVVAVLVAYFVFSWLIKLLTKALRKILERKGTDLVITNFIIRFIRISLTVLLVVILIGTLGVNTTSFAALIAAMGMAIGLALSGTMQNLAGGFIILAFKPFKAGDFIEAQGCGGVVQDVTFISTKIRTYDNKVVYIPNGILANGNIINHTHRDVRRVEWKVSLEYGVDSASCKELLLSMVKEDARILDSSADGAQDPSVNIAELADSCVRFVVRAWVRTEDYWSVFYDMNEKIYERLPEHGFNFPFPQLDIHVKTK